MSPLKAGMVILAAVRSDTSYSVLTDRERSLGEI